MMHASTMILGHAALLCGSLAILAITFQEVIQIRDKSNNLDSLNESFDFVEIKCINMNEKNNNVLRKTFFLLLETIIALNSSIGLLGYCISLGYRFSLFNDSYSFRSSMD